jgi:hypothetical protein
MRTAKKAASMAARAAAKKEVSSLSMCLPSV